MCGGGLKAANAMAVLEHALDAIGINAFVSK
jgi:hypothetical protein